MSESETGVIAGDSEYMRCDFGTTTQEKEDISLEGQVVPRKDTFRYLGSMLLLRLRDRRL